MSSLNERAKEVLDLCLASESPDTRFKVYEIIKLSGLDPSDPLFLVLALTGQMRVFLEAAPAELGQLLDEWKKQNAESLSQIQAAIGLVKETHQEQVEAIKQALESVSRRCVTDVKEAGMATTSAIAEANNETLNQARQASKEAEKLMERAISLHASVEADRQANTKVLKESIKLIEQRTNEFNTANMKLKNSIFSVRKLQQQIFWAKFADWFTPLSALLLMATSGCIAGVWLTTRYYNSPAELLGRNLTQWNKKQLVECINHKH